MLELVSLKRVNSTDQGTHGILTVGDLVFHTIELPWRDNASNISCIPVGEYKCRKVNSPRFGSVYHVQNVPGRSNVLIHSGNYAGDTTKGYRTHSHGCILIGKKFGQIQGQDAVLLSRFALTELHNAMDGEPFTLIIMGDV